MSRPAAFCKECLATEEYNREFPEYPRLYCSRCGRIFKPLVKVEAAK